MMPYKSNEVEGEFWYALLMLVNVPKEFLSTLWDIRELDETALCNN